MRAGGEGIFTGSGGPTTTIVDTSGPFRAFIHPSINNLGIVAFVANPDTGGIGVFTTTSGSTTTIADSGLFPNLFSFGRPSISDNQDVVAFGVRFLGGSGDGIYAGNGGPITTIANTNGPFRGFGADPAPSINARGVAAFGASLDSGLIGIFTGQFFTSGAPIPTVADTSGPFSDFGLFRFFVSINDSNKVAFVARLRATGRLGIFTGPDAVADKVIAEGDPLSGSLVVNLSTSHDRWLNNAGQIVFFARLADGTEGIYRADPQVLLPPPAVVRALHRSSPSSLHAVRGGADPVDLATGSYLLQSQDLAIPTRGLPLEFTRTYHSATVGIEGPLGFGWTHNYNMFVFLDLPGVLVVRMPDGRLDRYVDDGTGIFEPPLGIYNSLTFNSDDTFLTRLAV